MCLYWLMSSLRMGVLSYSAFHLFPSSFLDLVLYIMMALKTDQKMGIIDLEKDLEWTGH